MITPDLPPATTHEARLRLALDSAQLGVWDWDVRTGELRWDARIAELHGHDPATFDGRMESFLERVHPEDLPGLESAIQAALVDGDFFLEEFRVMRPDGTTAWIQGRGAAYLVEDAPVRMIGVGADTTVLHDVREHIGRTLEHVLDGVAVVDPSWHLVFLNTPAARLLQRSPQAVLGRSVWEAFPESLGTEFEVGMRRAMDTQQALTIEAYYGPLAGWFEVRCFPAPDGLTVYFRNVDERRSAERERAELISQLTMSLRRSEQLLSLTRSLARALSPSEVAEAVAEEARQALGCRFAGVAVIDDERQSLHFLSMAPLPEDVVRTWTDFPLAADVPAAAVARSGDSQHFADRGAIAAAYPHIADDLARAGTQGMVVVPLVASGTVIGSLMVTWPAPHSCPEEEQRFLATLAGQCAQAIERSQLFERQLSVAQTLQRAILPDRLADIPGVALAASYQPAEQGVEVGGDWYDALALPDGRLLLVVGDVGGHGLAAAAMMGQLRNAARAYAVEGHAPDELVERLNRLLVAGEEQIYATLVCAVVDPATRAVRWSSAGHLPPVVRDVDGAARLLDEVHGPLLGVEADVAYGRGDVVLAPGATLVLYTDGLVEHRSRDLGTGLDELVAAVAAADPDDVDEFCRTLVGTVMHGMEREDDLCVLTARLTG